MSIHEVDAWLASAGIIVPQEEEEHGKIAEASKPVQPNRQINKKSGLGAKAATSKVSADVENKTAGLEMALKRGYKADKNAHESDLLSANAKRARKDNQEDDNAKYYSSDGETEELGKVELLSGNKTSENKRRTESIKINAKKRKKAKSKQ